MVVLSLKEAEVSDEHAAKICPYPSVALAVSSSKGGSGRLGIAMAEKIRPLDLA